MLKLAYRIGVELALMKSAQTMKLLAKAPASLLKMRPPTQIPPTLLGSAAKGGSRAEFREALLRALRFQGNVPKGIEQGLVREQSFYQRAPEWARALREAYGL